MALTKEAMYDIALGRGGSYGATRDVLKHQVWDTRYFGTTATNYTFFATGIGNSWYQTSSKTLNETNLYDSGKLPNGQTFLVKRIGFALLGLGNKDAVRAANLVQDYIDIMQHSVVELKIQGREWDLQMHGRQFLPAVAMSEYHATGATNIEVASRVGDVIASGWYSLDHIPIFIDSLVSFSVVMTVASAVANINTNLNAAASSLNDNYATVQCMLEGVITKAK